MTLSDAFSTAFGPLVITEFACENDYYFNNCQHEPSWDGQICRYCWSGTAWPQKRLYYVNGMNTQANGFRHECVTLNRRLGVSVVGVYNASGGFAVDITQCVADLQSIKDYQKNVRGKSVMTLPKMISQSVKTATKAVEGDPTGGVLTGAAVALAAATAMVVDLVAPYIPKINKATASLMRLLIQEGASQDVILLLAYSQGCLISSNALSIFASAAQAGGWSPLPAMFVFGFGSPAPAWPPGVTYKDFANVNDPVRYISGEPVTGLNKGDPIAPHEFDNYVTEKDGNGLLKTLRSYLNVPQPCQAGTKVDLGLVAGKTYTVQAGDSLSLIASRLWGDPLLWPILYDANTSVVGSNPNLIDPGQSLSLPSIAGCSPADLNAARLRGKAM